VTGPDPAVAAVRCAVRVELEDLPAGSRVLVACSGGQDSLALAAAAGFLGPRMSLRCGAVVVDHGWRPESAQVCQVAAASCRVLGLDPVICITVGPGTGGGPEAAARTVRYRALERVADGSGAAAVLLGHTLDDQAETVLLGLARGSGTRSLSGMPRRRGLHRRPLLGTTREQTGRACAALGLDPWQDPANDDPAYTRSRLRAATGLLTDLLGPGLTGALARSAQILRSDADALDELAGQLGELVRRPGPAGALAALDVVGLRGAPAALRRRVLLRAVRDAGSPAGAVGSRHVHALEALVVDWHGQGSLALPGGLSARRECGTLLVVEARHGVRRGGPAARRPARDDRTVPTDEHRE
jgi:tRNA(Ile)-lysidine synthase